eukprot:CAMPEP_0181169418 /NCGR_PEP_ID=MMETSP1096-20121128/804_1 /TAXON_ID=156174 ORGANISM="Chrysochromulina ericina, Strain CCMP281" /NCGR_SAMPLE_ID=MMETSP1096 /ASSEMBLY_ACC=CAM_ASM_000453 /LENGTH=77 /DNA_ID=CAMNT_0023256875 /DNA_START=276 /DNA_END=509 /DNA_ORIENTATION=+
MGHNPQLPQADCHTPSRYGTSHADWPEAYGGRLGAVHDRCDADDDHPNPEEVRWLVVEERHREEASGQDGECSRKRL